MNLQIYYGAENIILDPLFIDSVSISADIHDLLLTAQLMLDDIDGVMAFTLKFGESIRIVSESESTKKSWRFRVLSYEKLPSDRGTLSKLRFSLISEWFFVQNVATAAYRGPISSIVQGLVAAEPFFKGGVNTVFVEQGTDNAVVRYRIEESTISFIERVTKYALNGLSPMYCFVDHQERLRLLSIATILQGAPQHTIALLTSQHGDEASKGVPGTTAIPALSIALHSNGMEASSQRTYFFSSKNIQYTDPAALKLVEDSRELGSPLTAANSRATSITRFDWSVNPADGVAIAKHDHADKEMSLFYAVALVGELTAAALDIGSTVNLRIFDEATPYDGVYVVKHIDYMYRRDGAFCRVVLIRV